MKIHSTAWATCSFSDQHLHARAPVEKSLSRPRQRPKSRPRTRPRQTLFCQAPPALSHTAFMTQTRSYTCQIVTHPGRRPSIIFVCCFTTCRRRGKPSRPFFSWTFYIAYARRLHLASRPALASSTPAQIGAFNKVLDAHNYRFLNRCATVKSKAQPFPLE